MFPLAYLVLFASGLAISLTVTGKAIGWAEKWNILDEPGERKVHSIAKPRIGGIGIFAGFFIPLLTVVLGVVCLPLEWFPESLADFVSQHRAGVFSQWRGFLGLCLGGTIIFIGGLWDDRYSLSPRTKLIWQIFASAVLLFAGYGLDFYKVIWHSPIGFYVLSLPVTLFWMLFLINAFNLLDNMDGLSGGVAAITTSFFAVYAHMQGEYFLASAMSVLVGALFGFLRFNWNPSKIFMGDGGSLLIGFLIAAFSCKCTYYQTTPNFLEWFLGIGENPTQQGVLSVLTPLVIMAVPIFDTVTVVAIRWWKGRPIMVGDTNHFSHRLVALGLSQKHAVQVIYLVTIFTGLGALILRNASVIQACFVFAQVLCVFGMILVLEWGQWKGRSASQKSE